ncbi:cysteine-rich CWC family protein [Bradyrhizobium sp. UFLA05-153]|nr:cysteine-rich CWC family protein [Bradyrhizobium sp. Ec3.3]
MTNRKEILTAPAAPLRQIVCSRCGTAFSCALSGSCWCAEETARLPMPTDAEDCLCRDCLRKAVSETAKDSGREN